MGVVAATLGKAMINAVFSLAMRIRAMAVHRDPKVRRGNRVE